MIEIGKQYVLACNSTHTSYMARRGKSVTVLRRLPEVDGDGDDRWYTVKADDGWQGDVLEEELVDDLEIPDFLRRF